MRLSIWLGTEQPSDELLASAEHAGRTGWDGIWVADHFMPNGERSSTPRLEAWTTIAAIAARVDRVRVGVLVTGNTYRHPAVLAKMAATVDHICGGRLVLGMGAGWQVNEHEAYGIALPAVGERLARLDEACQVIRLLHSEDRSNFEGRYYRLVDAPCEPKPVQRPLPLLIGGGGEKLTMRIAARHADEWNCWGLPDLMAHKAEVLEHHCLEVGRDPASIRHSAQAVVLMSDDAAQLEAWRSAESGLPRIIGTASQVAEVIARYGEVGVDEFVVPDHSLGRDAGEKRENMDRFVDAVAHHLQDRSGP
jgi:F420-dependent oxidoreductase-like protein